MKTKTVLLAGLVVVIGVAVASVVIARREAAQQAASQAMKAKSDQARNQARSVVAPVVEPTAPEPLAPEPVSPPPPPVKSKGQTNATTKVGTVVAPIYQDPRLNNPVFKEQLGRYALNFVGADSDADEVWALLIYDPSLSETVREDLMEDLNENGFSGGDGSVATVDDLPLIESRIALLEEHMPDADEFMLAHLAEAYKDLVNMWVRLSQQ